MKKRLLCLVLLICLSVPLILFSACTNVKPYNVAGFTFSGPSNVSARWQDNLSNEQKQEVLKTTSFSKVEEETYNEYKNITSIIFNLDGTIEVVVDNNLASEFFYYEQSEDLKTILLWKNLEKTEKNSYLHKFEFSGNNLYVVYEDANFVVHSLVEKKQ